MTAAMIQTIRRSAKTYPIKSVGASTHGDDGFSSRATGEPVNIKAHIQPMGAKELRNVPEGQNTLKWIVIWSESDLPEKNIVTYGGVDFTIQKTELWDDGGFYKAAAVHVSE